jgi:hypothetical protein
MPAVLYDRKTPETITLPESPFDQNGQRAVVDLTLDETGALAGTGELVLTGAHAWERIDWQDDDARTLDAWKKWLDDRFHGFAVSDVSFAERSSSPGSSRNARTTCSATRRAWYRAGPSVRKSSRFSSRPAGGDHRFSSPTPAGRRWSCVCAGLQGGGWMRCPA